MIVPAYNNRKGKEKGAMTPHNASTPRNPVGLFLLTIDVVVPGPWIHTPGSSLGTAALLGHS